MALPALDVLVTGLERRLGVVEGSLTGTARARAEDALTDASALVTSVAGASVVGDAETAASDLAVTLVYASGKRAFLNKSGAQSETAGPFSIRWGSAWLTEEERTSLKGQRGGTGLWVLETTRDAYPNNTVYVPVEGSENLFPWLTEEDM